MNKFLLKQLNKRNYIFNTYVNDIHDNIYKIIKYKKNKHIIHK